MDISLRRLASGIRADIQCRRLPEHTKTFHVLFVVFTTPTMAPITTFLVEYGHLLIGLSLLTGLMVRVSASFGVLLMVIYWMAHMDWPFIENTTNFDLRLSSRLCRRAGLPDCQARGSCLGARRLGGKFRLLQTASGPEAAGRLNGTIGENKPGLMAGFYFHFFLVCRADHSAAIRRRNAFGFSANRRPASRAAVFKCAAAAPRSTA